MVARVGVGASTASAIIFSVLLLSNMAVFIAAQGREANYARADAEDSLADEGAVLVGAGGKNLLLGAHWVLSSRAFDCATARASAELGVGSLSDLQSSGGVTARTTPEGAVDLTAPDNLSAVAPFDGSQRGEFDFALSTSVEGRDGATGVTYNRTEEHLVHLPVRLDEMSSLCADAVRSFSSAIEGSGGANCTSAAVAPAIEAVEQGISSDAASAGLLFGAGYSVAQGSSCTVSFVASVEQSGIEGPGGTFSVKMEEWGAASFSPRASG